jgi:phage terminase large subunit-like protein
MNKTKNMKTLPKGKVHQKQSAFFHDHCRNRWIFGGNRTGKTTAGAMEAVNFALGDACEGWVVSLSTQVQRDVAQRKVLEILDGRRAEYLDYECVMQSGSKGSARNGVIDFIVINLKNGGHSRIGFKNGEQGREKFQGTALDWVWFDEEPSEEIYEECLMRTLDKRGFVWGTLTPLKGKTWVYDRIFARGREFSRAGNFKRKNIDRISLHLWSWEDNPFLNKNEIKKMEKNFSAETLESRKYGRFIEGFGQVYKEFSNENIVRFGSNSCIENNVCYNKARRWIYTGISIDPGYTNPTAVLWFGVDEAQNIFVIDEYKEAHQSVEQIAKTIYRKSAENGIGVRNVFIDSAATARTLGEPKSVAEQFRAMGVAVDTSVEKNVLDGIHRVKGLFCAADGVRKLFIYENCAGLIAEIRGYFWGDNERPVKRNDHLLDALRYFVMSSHAEQPAEKPERAEKPRVGQIEKFKRRLIKNG